MKDTLTLIPVVLPNAILSSISRHKDGNQPDTFSGPGLSTFLSIVQRGITLVSISSYESVRYCKVIIEIKKGTMREKWSVTVKLV